MCVFFPAFVDVKRPSTVTADANSSVWVMHTADATQFYTMSSPYSSAREHVVLWGGSMWCCGEGAWVLSEGACGAVGREHVVL